MASNFVCKIEGCGKPVHNSHGWCCAHYKRWWRHGDPLAGRASNGEPLALLERLIGHEGDDCVPWPHRKYAVGYGKVLFEGRIWKAHRLMCVMAHGEPDDWSLDAAHNCGNANCVNPNHIRWATRLSNCEDKKAHGTEILGSDRHNAKLTEADIPKIRRLYADGQMVKDIAARFGVSGPTVSNIAARRTWRQVA